MVQGKAAGGEGEAPRLGNYGNNSAVPGQSTSRVDALRLREVLWEHSSIADVRKCGRVPCVALMPVRETPGGFRLGGLCRCHSVWLCPICAPEIRAARGVEIGLAVELHLHGAGGVDFGTLTLPHGVGDRLKDSYSVVASAWASVSADWAVRRFREAHGYWGFIRTCEVTYGENGWHPHLHWLDFWESLLSAAERAEYRGLVLGAWSRSVVRQGMREPSAAHGVRILPVRDGEISDYVTKLSPAGAGHELTQLSTKEAKRFGLAPFDVLRLIQDGRRDPWLGLWWEYEGATRGRRMLGTSRRLMQRLGLSVDDPEPVEVGPAVGFVSSEDWGRLRWFGGGLNGVQAVIEAAAVRGHVGITEAMRLLLGGAPLAPDGPEQLVLLPGDNGEAF